MIAAFWEPLTAISTLALALVTTFLALSTRRLAGNARDEVRANWRPVLSIETSVTTMGAITPDVSIQDDTLWLNVHNVGRGPALHVSGTLAFEKGERPAHRFNQVVGPDAYTSLSWPDFEPPSPEDSLPLWTHRKGSMTCLDVSHASYQTEFTIGFAPGGEVKVVDLHVKPIPELPPSGSVARVHIALLNARFNLARARSKLAEKVVRRGRA